jgi:chaperonin GroES
MVKIKPLGPRVLVKPLSASEKTKSGIYLPESAKEKPEEGEVLEVGEGKWLEGKLVPLSVKKGDRIIFSKYGPDEIKVDDEELLIVKEEDILAIVEK